MKLKLLTLLLLLSNCVFSQIIDNKKLDSYLNYIESNNLGIGSLSIFKGGKEVYNKDFGQKNLVYSHDNKYHIGSVTKMMTATLTFKLIEQGKLKLEDKLAAFYPEIPNAQKITIKNLLGHTSGLGNYPIKDGKIWVTEKLTEKAILDFIVQQGVSSEPDEKVAYSNTAYYLLTKILEKKYKQPYHKIIEKEIVRPLKLKELASVKSNPENVFKSYRYENKGWKEIKEVDFMNVIGLGDLTSNAKELNVFNDFLFQGKIIKRESLAMMIPVLGKESWGRGMALWDFDGINFYGHSGDTLGSHALLIYNREANISISYITNGERIPRNEFIKNIVRLIYNNQIPLPLLLDSIARFRD